MADFSDVILVTDLDDTLLTKDKRISDEDYKALVNAHGEIYMLFDRKNDKNEQYNLAASEGAVDIENDIRKKLLTAIAENIIIPSTTVQTAKAITK